MHPLPKSLIRLLLAALLLALTLPCQRHLLEMRKASAPYRPEELADAPPGVAFTTVALGSARGIVADLLWLRSFDLQADGRYFELMQLARWITALAANEPQSWIQQAWNLSYNIPPILADPEQKWHWVDSGVRLLRGEGFLHAGGTDLYGELALILSDKIGGQVDSHSPYYAMRFAADIAPLLDSGGTLPPPEDPRRARLLEAYRLVPAIVSDLETTYACQLDWRTPLAHAAYWAYRGRLASPPHTPSKRCDRLLYQAFHALYQRGRDATAAASPLSATIPPDPTFFQATARAMSEAATTHTSDPIMPAVHASFLRKAVVELHRIGDSTRSRLAFDELARLYPDASTATGYDAFLNHYRDTQP